MSCVKKTEVETVEKNLEKIKKMKTRSHKCDLKIISLKFMEI